MEQLLLRFGARFTVDPGRPVGHFLTRLADEAPTAALAAVIAALTYAVARFFSGRLRRVLVRGGFQVNAAILLARALWVSAWTIGLVLVLYLFGVGLTPLAAFIGVVGLAASLSLQQVLQNLVAGVYLLAERPFQIGDLVAVIGPNGLNHTGTVVDIQMRTTRLRNADDEIVLVPNATIFTGVVTNRTAVGGYVTVAGVTFPRSSDPGEVRTRALVLLRDLGDVLPSPAPRLRVGSVGADHWSGTLAFWSREPESAADALWAVAQAFPEATVNEPVAAVVP